MVESRVKSIKKGKKQSSWSVHIYLLLLTEQTYHCSTNELNAIEKAEQWHDRKRYVNSMYKVYKKIKKTNKL